MRAAPLVLAAALAAASCGPQVSADPVNDFAAWRESVGEIPPTTSFAVNFGGNITPSGWIGSQRFQLGGALDFGPDIIQRLEFDFEARMQDLPVPSPLGDRVEFGLLIVNDGMKTWIEPRVDQDWLSRLLADAPEIEMLGPRIVERVNAHYGYRAVSRIAIDQSRSPAHMPGFAEPAATFEGPKSAPRPVEGVTDERLALALGRLGANIRSKAAQRARADRGETIK